MISIRRLQRLWWQVRYLRPLQVMQRLHLRLRPAGRLAAVPAPAWQAPSGPWVEPAPLPASWRDDGTFLLLGSEVPWISETVWCDRAPGKKFLMELNTFNWLWSAGPNWGSRLMQDWVSGQPLPEGAGWHPYITSQRIVNWLKRGLAGEEPCESLRLSLAQQMRYLEPRMAFDECDHKLINNAKALLFAGFCLVDPRAKHWRERGLRLLARYLPQLVLADGAYTGRSPMYHNALLHDLLDIVNLLRAFCEPLPAMLQQRAEAAIYWSRALCHADRLPAMFNDTAFDVVPDTFVLAAYARRLGLQGGTGSTQVGSCCLSDSGFGRLSVGAALVLADIGPPGPDHAASHGHAGTLGFEFSLARQRVFIDTGLSTYEDLRYRLYERSTAAHNTVVVDDQNSSDVWGLFKLGRRARIVESAYSSQPQRAILAAAHNGYARSGAPLVHRREWHLDTESLRLEDVLQGTGEHTVAVYFHLHPALTVDLLSPRQLCIRLPDARHLILEVDSCLSLVVEEGYCATRFGERTPSLVLRAQAQLTLPARLGCKISGWSSESCI